MKNKILKVIIVLTGLFGAFITYGWSFFIMATHSKKKATVNAKEKKFQLYQKKINSPRHKFKGLYTQEKEWAIAQPKKDYYITSKDGLLLHAAYMPAKDAKRIVILCHGYKGSPYGDFSNIIRYLHENQCSLLMIDERCCGESEGEYITFGAMEKWDIRRWAYFASRRNKKKLPIYLFGASMGAASVLMSSEYSLPKDVKGIIADCGFTSMEKQLQYIAKNWYHLLFSDMQVNSTRLLCEMFAGFRMKDADTTQAMEKNTRPILFFHGARDTFVEPTHSKRNYAMCRAPKDLVIMPTARHLCSAYTNPELYRKRIMSFFEKYD